MRLRACLDEVIARYGWPIRLDPVLPPMNVMPPAEYLGWDRYERD